MKRHPPCLPEPSIEAQSHSQELLSKILTEISLKGAISFARYMEMALYEPGFGYYCAGNLKFGQDGDFVTAPEISPLFSCCIARQCEKILDGMTAKKGILELGAGSGKMACDLLLELERKKSLPDFYWILDLSSELAHRQKILFEQRIPHLLEKITWLSSLPTIPFEGVILANEVVDAMPVHRFRQEKTVKEYFVSSKEDYLIWALGEPSNPQLLADVERLKLPNGYSSEINLMLEPWLKSLSQCLKKGVLLIIDYGYLEEEYYHPQRTQGTLTCFYRHRSHDNPLILPGIQDITAHVNFTALGKAGLNQGFEIADYSNQARFLMRCGLLDLADREMNTHAAEQFKIQQQIKQLTFPTEMGELFKVIMLTKNFDRHCLT